MNVPKPVGRTASVGPGVLSQQISLSPPSHDSQAAAVEEKLSFWELIDQIPDEDWWNGDISEKGTKVYLYDREYAGRYLDVINHPFDIEWIKQKYGPGSYRVQLSPLSGKATSTTFSIDGEPKRRGPQSVQNAPAAAVAPDSFQTSVLQILTDGQRRQEEMNVAAQRRQEQLLEKLIDRDRAPNQSSMLNPMEMFMPMMQGVVTMFSSIVSKNQGPSLVEMLTLTEKLRGPDLLQVLTQAKAAGLIPDVSSGGSMIEQLSGLMAVAEKMGWTQGAGGKSWAEMLVDKGPDILKVFSNGISEYRQLEEKRLETAKVIAGIQRQQQPAAVPPPVAVTANPNGKVIHAVAQPGQGAAAPTARPLDVEPIGQQPIPVAPGQAQQVVEITEAQMNQMKGNIVNAIAQKLSGVDVFSYLRVHAPFFLDFMCNRDTTGQVVSVVTTAQLSAFCADDPVLQQAVHYPNFTQVIEELLAEVRAETLGEE